NDDELNGQVTFDIKVTNRGNITLYDIFVKDDVTEEEWTIDELAPGASDTHPVSVVITQEMIDGKCYINTASAEVRRYFENDQPGSEGPSLTEEYEVIARDVAEAQACFTQNAALTLDKQIDGKDTYQEVGDEIGY